MEQKKGKLTLKAPEKEGEDGAQQQIEEVIKWTTCHSQTSLGYSYNKHNKAKDMWTYSHGK